MGLSSVASLTDLPRLRERWTSMSPRAEDEELSSRHYLLILRFALLNGAMGTGLGAAAILGWLSSVLATDGYHLVKLICLVFIVGLYQCAGRIFSLSSELNDLARGRPAPSSRAGSYLRSLARVEPASRSLLAASLKLKLATRLGAIRYMANLLVLLGLVGTVLGFIVALSGIDPAAAGDVNAIRPMVSTLLEGMAIALYTTLIGSILNIWLMFNYRILEQGTVHYYTKLVELGERR
jgi:hypothetical protein